VEVPGQARQGAAGGVLLDPAGHDGAVAVLLAVADIVVQRDPLHAGAIERRDRLLGGRQCVVLLAPVLRGAHVLEIASAGSANSGTRTPR
jgi:hypothetical protein